MIDRRLLVAILGTALVGVVALSAATQGHQVEVGIPFRLLASVLLFGLAILGNRFAWGVAFVTAFLASGFTGAWAILTGSPDRSLGWLACAVWAVVALSLWGLKPEDVPAEPPPEG